MDQQNHQSMNTIQQALHDYKMGVGHFAEQMPDIAHKYSAFTEACFEAGELSQKEKQLIALGIALYSQDEYCIIYHTKGCLDQGCSQKEILEAVAVTGAFGGGAAMSQAVTLVEQCLTELDIQPH
ncbi:carboxymuconolactone decarboxylase family protein [Alteribacter aurantiacus]|uniref:carboxymuconolactone decarboxylase family protein n=1 Tax=Alteribacter aurantiacus TaxID=254410 RepID=UPI00040222D3|nr:carboxymuconolactone decarboxylase family protein [Alteribacter aurantiacus]